MIYTFEAKLRNMEHEIGNISIARIRQMNPSLKGINNDFVMDRSEHYISENMNPIFKYPLRLDGIIISIREKGSAKVNINLREYDIEQNRSEERRVGKECASMCRSRWSPYH